MVRKTTHKAPAFGMREAHTLAVLWFTRQWDLRTLLQYVTHGYSTYDADALSWLFECIGGTTMARGGKAQPKDEGKQWTRFVEISLAGHTKDQVYATYRDFDAVAVDLSTLLMRGCRIGVSYNEGNSSYIVSVTARDDGDPNKGCTFSAHGPDWYTALIVALYKHFVVCSGDWLGEEGKGKGSDIG